MKRIISEHKGFTLIEIIASVLILSFIGIIVSMGMVQAITGYVYAKQHTETLQKGQSAMARLVKELNATTSISVPTSSSLQFNSILVRKDSNTLKLQSSVTDDDILTDNVKDFKLIYYEKHDSTTALSAVDLNKIKIVDIELTMTGANNSDVIFKDRIFLRNLVN